MMMDENDFARLKKRFPFVIRACAAIDNLVSEGILEPIEHDGQERYMFTAKGEKFFIDNLTDALMRQAEQAEEEEETRG